MNRAPVRNAEKKEPNTVGRKREKLRKKERNEGTKKNRERAQELLFFFCVSSLCSFFQVTWRIRTVETKKGSLCRNIQCYQKVFGSTMMESEIIAKTNDPRNNCSQQSNAKNTQVK